MTNEVALEPHFVSMREEISAFAARHFGPAGSLRLHMQSLATDIFLAPVNLLLVGPRLFINLLGFGFEKAGARKIGRSLRDLDLAVPTAFRRRVLTNSCMASRSRASR
ncbi:MAG: DUF6635 family protein, partial [Pseudomonadota bacterium]